MTATARNETRAHLDETIDLSPGRERPAGAPPMDKASPQAPFRYTYGSGSRPVDGYTIKRAIGRGGFGEVYYATSDSGKEVALKLITRNVEIERRGVAQCMNLKCQNLLTIFDIKTNDAGETFVVMEYVSGPSLAGVLEKYPKGMPLNEARAWLKGLVEGVDYLHDHGIVHRDLKPANLFMEDGVVKIGDYGLSKIISPTQGSEHSESIGTCHYMAPEVSTGKYHKPIDIYAIGVIIYEMLTGVVPFEGETVGEVLMKHLTTRPDLSRLAEPYRTIVGEALAKDPVNRPKRAQDLLGPDAPPKARDVRFIGEGKVSPPVEPEAGGKFAWFAARLKPKAKPAPAAAPKPEEEVLRIGEVDPVFYIGPETRPPGGFGVGPRRRPYIPPIRWVNSVIRRPAPPRPGAAPKAAAAARPTRPPARPTPPPPVEPPRPSARVRVAELAGSMVKAALLTGLLAVPLALAEGNTRGGHPEAIAFMFATVVAGVWAALVPSKLLEGTKVDPSTRRFVNLFLGGGVGLLAFELAHWLRLPLHSGDHPAVFEGTADVLGLGPANMVLGFTSFFAAAFLANGWWKFADRDRPGHIRVWPLITSAVVAYVLTPLWPFREPVQLVIPAIALVVQLVSPWDRQAAAYAAYTRLTKAKVA